MKSTGEILKWQETEQLWNLMVDGQSWSKKCATTKWGTSEFHMASFLGIQYFRAPFNENLSVHIFQDFAFATLVNGSC